MDGDLKRGLIQLLADIQLRHAKIGDLAYDTLISAYSDLIGSAPNYGYVRRIIEIVLQRTQPC